MDTSVPQFVVKKMQLEDVIAVNEMRLESWLDTYVNEEAGVSREWVETRNELQRRPEKLAARKKKFEESKIAAWVAKDHSGRVIGAANPYVDERGVQHVGSLYVEKRWHGKGVAPALMQKIIDSFDSKKPIVLGVASYNERAKAFYQKWGFKEIPGSETLFEGIMPEIMMERKGD